LQTCTPLNGRFHRKGGYMEVKALPARAKKDKISFVAPQFTDLLGIEMYPDTF